MSGDGRRAFVTGATGFVGLNLIEELLAQGWKVTALHRPSSDLTYLGRLDVDLAPGSILDPASLDAAIPDDVDTVFHVAGDTNQWSKKNAAQTATNKDGTTHVVDASLKKKARRLVVTSSISAYGMVEGEIDESTPQKGAESWVNYQRSKWQGEEEARKGIEKGLPAVIMNPGVILGPYDTSSWGRIFLTLASGAKLPGPPGTLTAGHVKEIVKAHIVAADKGEVGGNYLLAGHKMTALEMFTMIHELMGLEAPTSTLPPFAMKIAAYALEAVSMFTGKEPLITKEMAAMVSKANWTKSEKAQKELGYKIIPARQGLEDNYNWLKAEGLI